MTLEQAIALLTDVLANHKDDRSRIQKELGNLRTYGFEVKVVLNAKTTALVQDAERLLTKLTAVKAMQSIAGVQVETQQTDDVPEVVEVVLDAFEERTVEQVALLGLNVHSLLEIAQNEVSDEAVVKKVEAFKLDELQHVEAALEGSTETLGETAENLPFARTRLTEIMAQPDRPSTEEEEREEAMLEELFEPWVQESIDDLGETTLPDIHSPSDLLNSQSQTIQTAKSFESIVLVLVVIVLAFKAVITVIKAIEESEIAIAQAKNFEQMYAVVCQKVRHKVQGFAVA